MDGGTTAWGDDAVELLLDSGTMADSGGGGGVDISVDDSLCVRMGSGDLSGMEGGTEGATGNSREARLEVSTANPASFSFLTRSAIEGPTCLFDSALGSLIGDVSRV